MVIAQQLFKPFFIQPTEINKSVSQPELPLLHKTLRPNWTFNKPSVLFSFTCSTTPIFHSDKAHNCHDAQLVRTFEHSLRTWLQWGRPANTCYVGHMMQTQTQRLSTSSNYGLETSPSLSPSLFPCSAAYSPHRISLLISTSWGP